MSQFDDVIAHLQSHIEIINKDIRKLHRKDKWSKKVIIKLRQLRSKRATYVDAIRELLKPTEGRDE